MTKREQGTLWNHHRLTFHLDDIAGGLPTDARLIDAWQQARWSKVAKLLPEDPQNPEEAAKRTRELLGPEVPEEAGWTTFARDDQQRLCIEGRQIKAALKESANILKTLIKIGDKTVPLRARLAERVFVVERLLPLLPERQEPDDTIERAIHVMTAQGPRDALKRTDIVRKAELVCTLKVLNDGMFTHDILSTLLDHGSENGLGADRSQGFGRFTFELES